MFLWLFTIYDHAVYATLQNSWKTVHGLIHILKVFETLCEKWIFLKEKA